MLLHLKPGVLDNVIHRKYHYPVDSLVCFVNAHPLDSNPGGVLPLYQVHRYVPPQRVWTLSRFGLKTGIDFENFGLKLGMVIGGTFTKAYKLIFLPSNQGE